METLIDSGLDHITNSVVPFWHWYVAAEGHETGFLSITTLSGPQSRRGGALKAMRLIGEPIKPLAPIGDEDTGIDREIFIRSWLLPDREEYVKVAALEYLAICGDASDLPILNAEFAKRNYQTVAAAADAIIRINLRQSRENAIQALFALQPETLDDRLVASIFAKPASIPTGLLLEGAVHRRAKVRSTVVSILAARNALPSEIADELLDDSDASVRFCALQSLIREGREISDEKARSTLVKLAQRAGGIGGLFGAPPSFTDREGEALAKQFIRARLRSQSDDALKQLCDNPKTVLDHFARLALDFKHFRTRSAALRAAVDDRFQAEFDAILQDLESRLIDADTVSRIKAKEDTIKKDFVRQATDLLCEKSEPEDLARVRKVIASGFVDFSPCDAGYLKRHGEWQDVSLLVSVFERPDPNQSLVSSLYEEDKLRPIAEAIHAIAKDRLNELCKTPMPSRLLVRVIELATDREIGDLPDGLLLSLFGSEADDLKRAILLRTIKALPKTRARKLLTTYASYDGSRYYSVFYWLDLASSLTRRQVLHAVEVTNMKRR